MITKAKPKTDPKQDRDKRAADRQRQLDSELADSFPASDPPSITQPLGLKPGRPDRNEPRRR